MIGKNQHLKKNVDENVILKMDENSTCEKIIM
jgi:hypothetical protein